MPSVMKAMYKCTDFEPPTDGGNHDFCSTDQWSFQTGWYASSQAYLRGKMTCARVPGKVILTGEHAVVYGVASLALALDHHAVAKNNPCIAPRPVPDFIRSRLSEILFIK